MHIVLYALSAVVLVVSVAISLVAVRRAHEGRDLDLELTSSARPDAVGRDRAASRSPYRTAA